MTSSLNRGLLMMIFLLAPLFSSTAQWSGSFSLGSGYDDNAFSNVNASESSFGFANLDFGFYPETENIGISYTGMFASYGNFPDRRYSTHSIFASFIQPYGNNDRNKLSIAGSFGLRSDAPDYQYYDYNQTMAYITARHYLGDILNANTGYSIRFRKYQNFDDMSYTEHTFWLGANHSFSWGTSITVLASVGMKNYSPFNTVTEDPQATATSANPGLNIEGGGGGGGGNGGSGGGNGGSGGSGGEGSGGNGNGNGGRMNEMGTMGSGISEHAQFVTYDDATTSQLRTKLTLGQSITETTGLSISYLRRWNLDDRSRAVVGGTVDFIGEEELFDDPYSYASDELSLRLTKVLPASMKLQFAGFMSFKRYSYPADFTGLSDITRNDKRYGGYATISKTIGGSWLLFSGLELSLGYTYTRNESNTLWYDYSSNDIVFGIGTDF
jgi:hypothetical protein